MAKRARGSTTRPGQRAPLQRSGPRPSDGSRRPSDISSGSPATAPAPRPANLTAEEEARAAELEAQILADEQAAAQTAARRTRERFRRESSEPVARAGAGSLAVRAGEEYGYVARDVRRIAIIGAVQMLLLVILWAAIQATGFGPF